MVLEQCALNIFTSHLQLLPDPLTSCSISFCIKSILLFVYSWTGGLPLEQRGHTRGNTLQKTNSSSPSSYPLLTVAHQGVGSHAQHPSLVGFGLTQVLCLLLQALSVHMCSCPAVSRWHCFCGVIHHPGSCTLFAPSPTVSPGAWKEQVLYRCPT